MPLDNDTLNVFYIYIYIYIYGRMHEFGGKGDEGTGMFEGGPSVVMLFGVPVPQPSHNLMLLARGTLKRYPTRLRLLDCIP